MNSCILMAQVVSDPELRSTQDNLAVSYMMVEFEGLKAEDPPARIRVVGWGNLATEIKQKYGQGDQIIIEGRLSMNVVELPEGYKEKRAELIASHIYPVHGQLEGTAQTSQNFSSQTTSFNQQDNFAASTPSYQSPVEQSKLMEVDEPISAAKKSSKAPVNTSTASNNEDWDDIPFVRPVNYKTDSEKLYDSWEVEANRPGIWLLGNKCLFL
ncbi:single-strand binding protein [Stanieria cyanosphaera PCC 7437]|uniref:Single-strand binding protein n=1 Tax=Stanieria cyanosphaera (strain ATCC 29371 / PCC 7437) TaxID=111780 RepID=K9XX36_STAC7|nr:single-stranded DNA-binding protein [Stanieria cyanosphaera]AFZ37083.1 single-strand binding protein [Stanieria cyanosphaera PCC 7437]